MKSMREPWCRRLSPAAASIFNTTNNNNNFNKINPQSISSFKLVTKVRPLGCRRPASVGEERGYLDSEEVERELLLLMNNSSNPLEFPTRKQLLDAGRLDLVNAISNAGGWLALGWDLEHQNQNQSLLPEQDTDTGGGVQGILNRLEKHRSLSFDIHMEDKHKHASSTTDAGAAAAAAAAAAKTKIDSDRLNTDLSPDKITSRLQHMQLELSSAIHSLRSKTPTLNPEVHESCGSELQRLSDVWEFQENEVMKAGDKLRSIRAKLAVLEGKISLSLMDTHKLVDEKQRRIDSARATSQLLRTTCVFWTHSALEVLLLGSFDGWTSKVKMEKTRTGVFCASLKLYPGRYEIKFIVDGEWRVDPMLPVVNNNGYENNVLVVHEPA